jgi:hypothetical protein
MRRFLFLGLTTILVVTLVLVATQSRRRAPATPPAPFETTRVARPGPTRAVAPADLEVVDARVAFGPAAPRPDTGGGSEPGRPEGLDAHHGLRLRNSGAAAYRNVVLEIAYFAASGAATGTRVHTVPGPVAAGKVLPVEGWVERSIADGAARARVRVKYADLDAGARPGDARGPS